MEGVGEGVEDVEVIRGDGSGEKEGWRGRWGRRA